MRIDKIQCLATQRGNALFLILIAVILFAALTYAITKSERTANTDNNEKLSIEYARYASQLDLAYLEFTKLRVKGCGLNNIPGTIGSVPAMPDIRCLFFTADGGNYPYGSATNFTDMLLIKLSLPGFGTAYDDVLAVVKLHKNDTILCDYINKRNGIVYTIDKTAHPIETYYGNDLTSSTGNFSLIPIEYRGKDQGCFYDSDWDGAVLYNVIESL